MIESRFSTDRRCIFREPCTPDSVSKNSGEASTGVTFENGVAIFSGTGKIKYPGIALGSQSFTLHVKVTLGSLTNHQYIMFSASGIISNGWALYYHNGGNIWCSFFDDDGTSLSFNVPCGTSGDKEIFAVVDRENAEAYLIMDGVKGGVRVIGAAFDSVYYQPYMYLGNVYTGAYPTDQAELFEIYQGTLSETEISLLHDNRLYSGFVNEGLVLHADYTRKTSLNWKDTDGTHTDTNTTYLHNIGLHCGGATKVEYGTALAITGDWSLETVVDRNGTGDFYPIGVTAGDRGVYIDFGSSGDWGFYDGTTDLTAEAAVTYFNRQHLVVTKTGTSYKFYRGGILVNTVVGIDTDITQITVGMLGDGTGGMNGNVVYTREYTGVLTAENVAQNHQYAVDNYGAI